MASRYYVYISDAKVDMMLSQIDPGFGRRITTEAGAGLKLFSARRTVQAPEPDHIARLERVLRHLEEEGRVGDVDEPGPFFRGRLPMRWGPLPGGGASTVYFAGRTARTILGLGGSGGHVLGPAAPPPAQFAPSSLPALLAGLGAALAGETGELPADDEHLGWVHTAGRLLRGPLQEVEFVARRLLAGPSPYPEIDGRPDLRVLLGSPLYVALAD